MRSHIQLSAARNYFLGFATSGAILLSGLYYFNSKTPQTAPPAADETVEYISAELTPIQDFDPNELTQSQWKNLGFSERQVATIMKYKQVVGGSFKSKEQLKKCYAISAEKFAQLEPYILLPEQNSGSNQRFANYNTSYNNFTTRSRANAALNIPGKFNPDHFTAQDFERMGFSARQSSSIIKYKNYLGGSFISKEKFKECYMISEENYRQLEPYILLPESAPASASAQYNGRSAKEKTAVNYQKFDPNLTDLEGWRALGFSEKQSQVIINYRERNLKGSFKTLEDIERCFVISPEKFAVMKPYIVLNPENFVSADPKKNSSQTSFTSSSTDEPKTDFSKVDLNQITYKQLLEFGFDEKSAAMMLGFRKKLGGFVNKQQIIDTYDIDKSMAQKLVSTARLDDSKVARYTLSDAPEDWLKNHPYFKYSADKIIFYRITNPDDRKIWKFLKVKPEYEIRMRMYLKDGN